MSYGTSFFGGKRPTAADAALECLGNAARVAVGGATYVSTVVFSQFVQRCCGIHTSTFLIPPLAGLATISLASSIASTMASAVVAQNGDIYVSQAPAPSGGIGVAILGLASHSLARSSIGSGAGVEGIVSGFVSDLKVFTPSNVKGLGAFHSPAASLPAGLDYAKPGEKATLNLLGRLRGCHSCGTRAPASFIGDHMPPKKEVIIANQALWRRLTGLHVKQRFYPQCPDCSQIQSRAVRMGRAVPITHYFRFRSYHAVGVLIALSQCDWQVTSTFLAPYGEGIAEQLHLAASAATKAAGDASESAGKAFGTGGSRGPRDDRS